MFSILRKQIFTLFGKDKINDTECFRFDAWRHCLAHIILINKIKINLKSQKGAIYANLIFCNNQNAKKK